MELFVPLFNLVLVLAPLVVGYAIGSWVERRHYRSILERERETLQMQVMTAEPSFAEGRVAQSFMVSGSAVISIDYFKRLLAQLRNVFGGRVKSYESLIDRARREAILRMKKQARMQGAALIVNLRLGTSMIGENANRRKSIGSIEAIAYGTAVVLQPK